jgi:hypothetical protein
VGLIFSLTSSLQAFEEDYADKTIYTNISFALEAPLKNYVSDTARFGFGFEWGSRWVAVPVSFSLGSDVYWFKLQPRAQYRWNFNPSIPWLFFYPSFGPNMGYLYETPQTVTTKTLELGFQGAGCFHAIVEKGNIRFCPVNGELNFWRHKNSKATGQAAQSTTNTNVSAVYSMSVSFGLNW